MKKFLLIMIAAVAAASCSKEPHRTPSTSQGGTGTLTVKAVCDIAVAAETRADEGSRTNLADIIAGYTAPEALGLRTLVACKDKNIWLEGTQSWTVYETAEMHNGRAFDYEAGDYVVTLGTQLERGYLAHYYNTADGSVVLNSERPYFKGDASALVPRVPEGEYDAGKVIGPCFEGRAETTVVKGEDSEVQITARVVNAAVCVEFTDAFRSYFPNGAEITIKTKPAGEAAASGADSDKPYYQANEFTTGYEGADDTAGSYEKRYFWVRPQAVTFSGSAFTQSPSPGILTPKQVYFADYTADIAAGTLNTFRFDIGNAGGTEITVKVNNDPVETFTDDVELNPNAPKGDSAED